jgi:DNA-binding NarL/FixJ family response regulator
MSDLNTQGLGRVLLVSRDPAASGQISSVLQEHALYVETSVDVSVALNRISNRKFEAVVFDLSIEGQAVEFLQELRASATNKTSVTLAITDGSAGTATALKIGFGIVLERPLTADSINHTMKVAYGSIVRERRRYFRYQVDVPVVLRTRAPSIVYGRTMNVSECGMAVTTTTRLEVGLEGATEFTLPDPMLRVAADFKVCWSNAELGAGLSLLFVSDLLASELQAWIGQKLEQRIPPAIASRFSK